jgi:phosphoglycolate phosphatase-like HAD superfamily hydrolase
MTVGDTRYDILASHRCTLPIAAVPPGGFDERLLKKAELRFDSVERIEEIDDYFNE